MKLTLSRDMQRHGRSDEWSAILEGHDRKGIGKSRTEAIGSLVSANLAFFGIDEREDVDPGSVDVSVTWRA